MTGARGGSRTSGRTRRAFPLAERQAMLRPIVSCVFANRDIGAVAPTGAMAAVQVGCLGTPVVMQVTVVFRKFLQQVVGRG